MNFIKIEDDWINMDRIYSIFVYSCEINGIENFTIACYFENPLENEILPTDLVYSYFATSEEA